MTKRLAVLALALLIAAPVAAQTNVSSRWVSGNLVFYDVSGNAIITFNGASRKLTIPSGSSLELASGSTVTRSEQVLYNVGGKVGATAGWTVGAASDLHSYLLPASQTNSTLVVPIGGLKVGDIITGFSLVGQIESAANHATITADLRKLTAAAADLTDASVGAMAAALDVTADTIISATNASKTGLTETVAADESFYVLLTGTTAANTDIALQGVLVTINRQ